MSEPIKIMLLSLRQIDPQLHDGAGQTLIARLKALQDLGCEVSLSNFLPKSALNQHIIMQFNLSEYNRKPLFRDDISHSSLLGIDAYHELLPYRFDEIHTAIPQILEMILNHIDQQNPDYIITVDDGFLPLLSACLAEIPGAHSYHSLENITFSESKPEFLRLLKRRQVICNSSYAKKEIQSRLKIEAHIWHSHINFQDLLGTKNSLETVPKKRYDVGFCSSHPIKGEQIVNRIVEKLPEQSFLIVGQYCSETLRKRENVTFLGHIKDMNRFYSQIRVMLIPSLVFESYPRVALEASAFGLPIIGNRVGGIPEALSDSGILIDIDLSSQRNLDHAADNYVHHIQNILNDPGVITIGSTNQGTKDQ